MDIRLNGETPSRRNTQRYNSKKTLRSDRVQTKECTRPEMGDTIAKGLEPRIDQEKHTFVTIEPVHKYAGTTQKGDLIAKELGAKDARSLRSDRVSEQAHHFDPQG